MFFENKSQVCFCHEYKLEPSVGEGVTYCTGPNLIKTIIFRDPGLFGSCSVNNFWLVQDKTKASSSLKGLSGNNQKSGPFS